MANVVDERVLRAALSAAVAARLTDAELLQRFSEGNEDAFEALVKRHTGMVLGVCRRLLSTVQDAEDACQATFLVLARKSKTGRWQPSIANWLYTTARRVASKANRAVARRRKREARIAPPVPVSALDQMTGREAFAALDEELGKLAPIYREPLVLCYLQGLTRDEAALRLGIPAATLKSQLERGRKKLADALTKRGIAVGIGLMAVASTSVVRTSSPRLVELILTTIGGTPSSSVAALALEVTVNGFVANAKWLLLATITLAVIGFGLASMPIAARPQKPAPEKLAQPETKPETNQAAKPKPAADERILQGKVLGADGKPIEAELSLVWLAAKPQALGKTKADGTFHVTVPLARNDEGGWLVASAPGHGTDFCPTGISYWPGSMTLTSNLTLKLPKERRVRGRVFDTQGKPVAGGLVVVARISAYDSDASIKTRMSNWATTTLVQGGSPPHGDRDLWFSEYIGDPEVNRSPYRTTTDQDGRFEMPGIGTGQMIQLCIKAKGLGNKEIVLFNRPDFDPKPINKLARDSEIKAAPVANKWPIYVPDPDIVMEREKIIRGTVTDPEGKPRAGVRVVFFRPHLREINPARNSAITDKDGHYETRGALKSQSYRVECGPDTETGILQCAASAEDTAGYELITIDLKCARGVIIQGRIKNKATNKPIRAQMYVNVLADNPFVKNYPNLLNAVFLMNEKFHTDKEGRFRVVTIPGPVILSAWPTNDSQLGDFIPPAADPKYPDYFSMSAGQLTYKGQSSGQWFVLGCWCKVIDTKEKEPLVNVNVELEPATKLALKVVDLEGKPVTDTSATGITHLTYGSPSSFLNTNTVTLSNVDPKTGRLVAVVQPTRKLVGSAIVGVGSKPGAIDPVIQVGPGGSVTGRAVDARGKPLAGLEVYLIFEHREVSNAFAVLTDIDYVLTNQDGEFRFDNVFPGQRFRFSYSRGKTLFGPTYDKAPRHSVAKHNEVLKFGDLKLEPTKESDEQ